MEHIGNKISQLLSEKRISQTELAKGIGKSKQAITSILKKANIDTGLLQEICDYLNVDIAFFLVGKNADQNNSSGVLEVMLGMQLWAAETIELMKKLDIILSDEKTRKIVNEKYSELMEKENAIKNQTILKYKITEEFRPPDDPKTTFSEALEKYIHAATVFFMVTENAINKFTGNKKSSEPGAVKKY